MPYVPSIGDADNDAEPLGENGLGVYEYAVPSESGAQSPGTVDEATTDPEAAAAVDVADGEDDDEEDEDEDDEDDEESGDGAVHNIGPIGLHGERLPLEAAPLVGSSGVRLDDGWRRLDDIGRAAVNDPFSPHNELGMPVGASGCSVDDDIATGDRQPTADGSDRSVRQSADKFDPGGAMCDEPADEDADCGMGGPRTEDGIDSDMWLVMPAFDTFEQEEDDPLIGPAVGVLEVLESAVVVESCFESRPRFATRP